MFNCKFCNTTSSPRAKQNKRVLEFRPVSYFEKEKAIDESGNEILLQGAKIGEGFEVVKEVALCSKCEHYEKTHEGDRNLN